MARKDKGTKDLFLQKALELFAERGYKADSHLIHVDGNISRMRLDYIC